MQQHVLTDIDVRTDRITYDELLLDLSVPLESQLQQLNQDLFQAEFPNGCVLDIGWYASFSPNGEFRIALNCSSERWEPITQRRRRTLVELKSIVKEFVALAAANG